MIFEGTKNKFFFGLGLTRAGKSLPAVDNLYALSRLFGVSIDKILVGDGEYFAILRRKCLKTFLVK